MKTPYFLSLIVAVVLLTSCNNNPSLQKYYVDNQNNKDFVAIDISTSMFASAKDLEPKEKKTLETINKINVLAIPRRTANQEKIDSEKNRITDILKDEKYQLLMKFGGNGKNLQIYYTGTEEAIDEIVVYGYDDKKGMGIARLLGNNMNPADIGDLIKDLDHGNVNMNGLEGIVKIFSDSGKVSNKEVKDSIPE